LNTSWLCRLNAGGVSEGRGRKLYIGARDIGSRGPLAVIRFIQIQNVRSLFNVWIHIKRRREPPSIGGQDEAVVSQVIVPVADRNIEGDSAKELFEICRNELLGPSMVQELCDLEITGSLAFILSQHRHRGGIKAPSLAAAIEALYAEGVIFISENLGPRGGHVDTRSLRKIVRE